MAYKDFWISILERLQPTIKRAHFVTWFQHTAILLNENGELKIGAPNTYAVDWISKKYGIKVMQASKELDPSIKNVSYEVSPALDTNGEGVDLKVAFKDQVVLKKVRKVRNQNEVNVTKSGSDEKISSKMLNNRYRLNNFVVGVDNRLPHAACSAVVKMPGGIYNPLYIYGSVGLGKTHLLQSVGNEILHDYPDMVVKYITAEKFVSEVVEAIGNRHMKKFKQQYRNVDVFLIDDVQFFARKDSSQQEFFHTFNELYDANKQIVLTSDRPPSELDGLDDRLKSRFGMGMVVELISPDYETRLAILQKKCQEHQAIIDPQVLSFIATNITHSVRALEGVLKQVVAENQLFNRVATISSVAEIIKRMNRAQEIIGYDWQSHRSRKTVKSSLEVMEIVAGYYKVSVEELVGKSRNKEIMFPRQICMYLIKNELNESYEKIGHGFGGRNHTTVMHACTKLSKQIKTDVRLVKDLNAIRAEMGL